MHRGCIQNQDAVSKVLTLFIFTITMCSAGGHLHILQVEIVQWNKLSNTTTTLLFLSTTTVGSPPSSSNFKKKKKVLYNHTHNFHDKALWYYYYYFHIDIEHL